MTSVTFTVEGRPAPQGSKDPKAGGRMVESSPHLAVWRQRVAIVSHNAMVRNRLRPFAGAVVVHAEFVMHRPARCPLPTPPATKRPDTDKLLRGLLDGITHTVIVDDALAVEVHASKRTAEPGEPTGVTVTVYELAAVTA